MKKLKKIITIFVVGLSIGQVQAMDATDRKDTSSEGVPSYRLIKVPEPTPQVKVCINDLRACQPATTLEERYRELGYFIECGNRFHVTERISAFFDIHSGEVIPLKEEKILIILGKPGTGISQRRHVGSELMTDPTRESLRKVIFEMSSGGAADHLVLKDVTDLSGLGEGVNYLMCKQISGSATTVDCSFGFTKDFF